MLLLSILVVSATALVLSGGPEPFEPGASNLAADVKKTFDQYVSVQKGGVDRVLITQARIVETTPPGITNIFSDRPVWKARIRAKPKLITTSGTFIGQEVSMEGHGPTEEDAIYDAKRGLSILRKELENLF